MLGLGNTLSGGIVPAVVSSFANSYAVAKGLTTGSSHYIRATIPSDSPINFVEDDAWTISFWVKPGWGADLNTYIQFMATIPSDASSAWDNHLRIYYHESYNRLTVIQANNPGAGNYDIAGEWLFHSDSGNYAAGFAAAGLGETYWSTDNKGNVGDNNFTLITVTKTGSTASSAMTLYWNATTCGAPPIQSDSSPESLGMVTNEEHELVIGSTVLYHSYAKCGNNAETQFNDFAIWDVALDADAVAAIYNSGTPIDLTSNSGNYDNSADLQLYYEFENNGTANTNVDLSGTDYDITVAGDSNFESL